MRLGLITMGAVVWVLAAAPLVTAAAPWSASSAAPRPPSARPSAIPWTADFDAAEARARSADRLVMVDFYADWCGACKMMDREVYPETKVITAAKQFVPVKLDVDHGGKRLGEKYVVNELPAILFLDGAGNVIDTITGAEPASDFTAGLNRIAREYSAFPALEKQAQAHPENIPLAVSVVVGILHRHRYSDALALVTRIESQGAAARSAIGEAYNRLGDYYFLQDQPAPAIPWYKKTITSTTNPGFIAEAHLHLAGCYYEQHNDSAGDDELHEVVRTPGAPPAMRDRAFQILSGQLQR